MDVKPGSNEEANTPFNPLAGWEAASRWNASAFDMMARAWQQWLALVTTVPATLVPGKPERSSGRSTSSTPVAREAVHAVARGEPKRPARSRGKSPKRTRD